MKIGIAGAGLLGRLLAFKFNLMGHQVTLFDADDRHGQASCGFIAAGMLAPWAEIETAESIIFDLGLASMTCWHQIMEQLGQPDLIQQTGSLLTSHPQDRQELDRFINLLIRKKKTDKQFDLLTPAQINELEPDLKLKNNQAYYFPCEGYIKTAEFYSNLETRLVNDGVKWHTRCPVQQLKPGVIYTKDQQHGFDWALDCRGLGARQAFNYLRGVRGEIIYVHAPEVNISRPIRLMHPRYPIYIVPRSNNNYVIGASSIESEAISNITVRSTLELLSAAYSLHTGFAEAHIINSYVNCRPALPDNLPKIKYQQGLMAINGLYRHGYLIAPSLVNEAINIVENKLNNLVYPSLVESI